MPNYNINTNVGRVLLEAGNDNVTITNDKISNNSIVIATPCSYDTYIESYSKNDSYAANVIFYAPDGVNDTSDISRTKTIDSYGITYYSTSVGDLSLSGTFTFEFFITLNSTPTNNRYFFMNNGINYFRLNASRQLYVTSGLSFTFNPLSIGIKYHITLMQKFNEYTAIFVNGVRVYYNGSYSTFYNDWSTSQWGVQGWPGLEAFKLTEATITDVRWTKAARYPTSGFTYPFTSTSINSVVAVAENGFCTLYSDVTPTSNTRINFLIIN